MEAVLKRLHEETVPVVAPDALPSAADLAVEAKKARKSKKRRSDAMEADDVVAPLEEAQVGLSASRRAMWLKARASRRLLSTCQGRPMRKPRKNGSAGRRHSKWVLDSSPP